MTGRARVDRLGNMTEMSVPDFKDWLSEEQTKPVAPELSKQDQLKADLAAKRAGSEQAPFDSKAFDRQRNETVAASKAAGNTHLDDLQPAVETMRGKKIYYAHDPKVTGTVRTVSNTGEVVVHWNDDYSAQKEMATARTEGKNTVHESWLQPHDLKDYVVGTPLQGAKAAPAAEKPAAFDAHQHVPAMQKLIGETNISLGDLKKVGNRLGLDAKQAHRVLGALAARPNAPIFQTKGRPEVRNKSGRVVKKAIPPRWQRIAKRNTPLHLLEFVRSIGGVRSDGHDLRNVGALSRYPGVINNKSGRSIDEIGEALHEAGYVHTGERPTESEVIDLLDRASHKRIYALEDIGRAADLHDQKYADEETQHHLDELRAVSDEYDLNLTDDELHSALSFVADGETHEYAVEAAVREAAAQTLEPGSELTGNDLYAEIANELYEGEHAEVRDYGPDEAGAGQEGVTEDAGRRAAPRGQPAKAGRTA
jgi:hypothetical protein